MHVAPNQKGWSHLTFSELHKYDPRKAYEFRRDTLGDPIPDFLLTEEEKAANAVPEAHETLTAVGESEKEAVKSKLDAAGIKYHHMLGLSKLQELAKQHNVA